MRLNLTLLLALVVSGLYLVNVSYDSRRQFVFLERANNEAKRLEVEYERLETEQRSQATPLRVEKMAREKLGMRSASPTVTHYLTAAETSAAGASSARDVREAR